MQVSLSPTLNIVSLAVLCPHTQRPNVQQKRQAITFYPPNASRKFTAHDRASNASMIRFFLLPFLAPRKFSGEGPLPNFPDFFTYTYKQGISLFFSAVPETRCWLGHQRFTIDHEKEASNFQRLHIHGPYPKCNLTTYSPNKVQKKKKLLNRSWHGLCPKNIFWAYDSGRGVCSHMTTDNVWKALPALRRRQINC